MITVDDILETNRMITENKLDVRTITMGISLRDCAHPNMQQFCQNIYEKITTSAEFLVRTGELSFLLIEHDGLIWTKRHVRRDNGGRIVCQNDFTCRGFQIHGCFMISKIIEADQCFLIPAALIGKHIRMVFQHGNKNSFLYDRHFLSRADQFLIEREDGIGIFPVVLNIYSTVALCGLKPWRCIGKAAVGTVIPLHWGSGVVTGALLQDVKHFCFGFSFLPQNVIDVGTFHIGILVNIREIGIRHADSPGTIEWE